MSSTRGTARARAFDPSQHLTVNDGAIWIGTIIPRGAEFQVFDIRGVFQSLRSAIRAIPREVDRG